jgi:hypothetical protein
MSLDKSSRQKTGSSRVATSPQIQAAPDLFSKYKANSNLMKTLTTLDGVWVGSKQSYANRKKAYLKTICSSRVEPDATK